MSDYPLAVPANLTTSGHGVLPLIGRGLGANQTSGGISATGDFTRVTPNHPTLDAIFNQGRAQDYANAVNNQVGAAMINQKQQLQVMAAQLQNEISLGNNTEQNAAKLAQVNAQIAQNQTKLNQIAGVATQNNVTAYNPSDLSKPTLGEDILANKAGAFTAENVGSKAFDTGGVLNSPAYNDALAKGMTTEAEQPYLQSKSLTVPGVGGVQMSADGQPTVITRQPDTSQSQSGVKMIDMGNGVMMPMQSSSSSSQGGGANVTIPVDQQKVDQVLQNTTQQQVTTPDSSQQSNSPKGKSQVQPNQDYQRFQQGAGAPSATGDQQSANPFVQSLNAYLAQQAAQQQDQQQQQADTNAAAANILRFRASLPTAVGVYGR